MSKSEINLKCSMVSWGYLLHNCFVWFIQRYACGTSSDNAWINLHRFWIHLLLLSAIASFVMRNGLLFFKMFIAAPYCWQKRTLTKAIIRFYLLSLAFTCCHSLSLAVPLIVIRCHLLYHLLLFAVIRYITSLSF